MSPTPRLRTAAGDRWRADLAAWEIPARILAQARDDPWAPPAELFAVAGDEPFTVSHHRALEALAAPGVVIDVGCGGGAMSAPLRGRATRTVAVDESATLLGSCAADERILGRWPEVAARAGCVDVAVCGHVLYNVPDLEDFVTALDTATRRRVVCEVTARHPRARGWEGLLWQRFWGLARPSGPGWQEIVAVLRELGIEARTEAWERPPRGGFHSLEALVATARRNLCLAPERDAEVGAALRDQIAERGGRWLLDAAPRPVVTLWWEPGSAR